MRAESEITALYETWKTNRKRAPEIKDWDEEAWNLMEWIMGAPMDPGQWEIIGKQFPPERQKS